MKTMNSLLDHPILDNIKFTDKKLWHSYLPIYEKHFEASRSDTFNLLEIGVAGGGSTTLWHSYFDNIKIHAIDILPEPELVKKLDRVTFYQKSAYEMSVIEDFVNRGIQFKYIIEDGPHTLESMIFVARHYHKILEPGGIIFIEDIKHPDWFNDIRSNLPNHLQTSATLHDLRDKKGRKDDILAVIQGQSLMEDEDV